MEEKVLLSYDQAVAMLEDGDGDVHVFMNPAGMLIGADWRREQVLKMLKVGKCELGGEMCKKMGHGLVCAHQGKYHFVQTKKATAEMVESQ
jgi:hypothetical protein